MNFTANRFEPFFAESLGVADWNSRKVDRFLGVSLATLRNCRTFVAAACNCLPSFLPFLSRPVKRALEHEDGGREEGSATNRPFSRFVGRENWPRRQTDNPRRAPFRRSDLEEFSLSPPFAQTWQPFAQGRLATCGAPLPFCAKISHFLSSWSKKIDSSFWKMGIKIYHCSFIQKCLLFSTFWKQELFLFADNQKRKYRRRW